MKFFLGPGNNSLSHILKCFTITDTLLSHGHEVSMAVSQKYSTFLEQSGYNHYILPDIQESDNLNFPSFKWFRNPNHISDCILAQANLLETLRPDRALGVFNFTLHIAAGLIGIPYDSLVCGCMLKESSDILGFHGSEADAACQKVNVETFFNFATQKLNCALKTISKTKIDDIRDLLKGEMTYLWDFPEFMPLPPMNNILYTGPIPYRKNVSHRGDSPESLKLEHPTAVLSFGTCSGDRAVMERLVQICLDTGLDVIIAAGGQKKYLSLFDEEPRVTIILFPELTQLLANASLLITHGGQITVFEALKSEVPVIVMPFQPEQAHNGVCLERMGCGRLLIPPQPFRTGPKIYIDAFNSLADRDIKNSITSLCSNTATTANLVQARSILDTYTGAQKLVTMLERPLPCPSVLS